MKRLILRLELLRFTNTADIDFPQHSPLRHQFALSQLRKSPSVFGRLSFYSVHRSGTKNKMKSFANNSRRDEVFNIFFSLGCVILSDDLQNEQFRIAVENNNANGTANPFVRLRAAF